MDINQITIFVGSQSMFNIVFKILAIFLAGFYVLYSFIISKQVSIMNKTLEDNFNKVIIFICSIQTTIALILFILVIFFA